MGIENKSCFIFLEGPSCSGKTCLLKTIKNPEVSVIFKNWPASIKNPQASFFMERDEDKLLRAKQSKTPTRIIDRSYLSTLTYYSVLEEQRGISAQPVYRWFINEIGNKLYRPNHYIFVDVSPEISLERAKLCNRTIDHNNMWLIFPERISYWYEKLITAFEPNTSFIRINGSRSLNIVSEEFNNLINNL